MFKRYHLRFPFILPKMKAIDRLVLLIFCCMLFFNGLAYADAASGSAVAAAPGDRENSGSSDAITTAAFGLMDQWKINHPTSHIKMSSVSPVSEMTQDVYVYEEADGKIHWKAAVMSLFPIQYSFVAYPSKDGDILTYFPLSAVLVRKTTAAELAKGMDPLMVIKGGSMMQFKSFCKSIRTEKTDSGYAVKCILDASKLNNSQLLMMHIDEVPMEINLDTDGQVNRTVQTVMGITTVSTLTWISHDNVKIRNSSPPVPDESTLDTNLNYQDALIQEIKFFKTKPQSNQTQSKGV